MHVEALRLFLRFFFLQGAEDHSARHTSNFWKNLSFLKNKILMEINESRTGLQFLTARNASQTTALDVAATFLQQPINKHNFSLVTNRVQQDFSVNTDFIEVIQCGLSQI